MKLLYTEILDKVNKAESRKERIEILRQHETRELRGWLKLAVNKNFDMGLPEGIPPYKKITDKPIGYEHTLLENEYKKLYIWLQPNNLSKTKKENLFVQVLESLHHIEADLLCHIKDHNLQKIYPNIDEQLVVDAFFDRVDVNQLPIETSFVKDKPKKRGRGRPRKEK